MSGNKIRAALAGILGIAALVAFPAGANAASFTNGTQIQVNPDQNAPGSIYPSPIAVTGLKGPIVKVKASLNGWNDSNPFGMDVILVSPGGEAVNIHDDGCVGMLNGETFTFDDDATATLPIQGGCNGKSGVFKPTGPAPGNAPFPAPAPQVTQNSTLATFKNDSPNGQWSLFVRRDVNGGLGGSFQGGWSLDIETLPPDDVVCAGKTATIAGTAGDDVLTGTPGADVIAASSGNDTVKGLAGNDTVCGGSGRDLLVGGAGKDRLIGLGGKDRCVGGAGKDKAARTCEKTKSV